MARTQPDDLWDLALKGSSQGLWDWNARTGEILVSPQWWSLRGHASPAFELTIERWAASIHPDDRERVMETMADRLRRRRTHASTEYRVPHADGGWRWLLDRSVAVWDDAAQPMRIAGSVVDVTELKEAEDAVRRSDAALQDLLRRLPDAVVVHAERKIVWVNDAAVQLVGVGSADEMIGTDALSWLAPEYHALARARQRRIAEGQTTVPLVEEEFLRAGGGRVPVEVSGITTTFEGRPAVVVVARDISSRWQVVRELRANEERFRLLSESARDLVCLHDPDGRLVYVSPSSATLLGYEPHELVGMDPYEFVHPDDALRIRSETHAEVLRGTTIPSTLYRFRRSTGEYTWLETLTQPIFDPSKRVVKLQTISRDVTDRLRVAEALERNEALFRATFEQAAVGVVHGSLSGRFQRVNRRMLEMTGYSEDEFLTLSIADITHPDDVERNVQLLKSALDGGHKTYGMEKRYLRKDGSFFWANLTASVARDEEGRAQFIIAVIEDTTERKRLEERLEAARAELESRVIERTRELSRANEELRLEIEERRRVERVLKEAETLAATARLAAGIAHEINNPLAGIKNSFLLIKDAIPLDHAYYRYVARIENEINRIADIIRQMYDLHRPIQEAPREMDLLAVLRDVVHLLSPSARSRGVRVNLPDDPSSAAARVAEGPLRRVLINVTQNAIDASPDGGAIEITLGLDEGHVEIAVRDHGPGVPPEIRDRIFEPFFTTKAHSEGRGMGLGLSISRSLCEAMGGALTLEPARGGGTLARIRCLRRQAAPKQADRGAEGR